MYSKRITCERARNLSIVKTLASFGHFPSRTTEKEAWFLSPLRSETQASFKVSLVLNKWYDHGTGRGGNGLDLIVAIKKCSVKEALELFSNKKKDFFFFQQPILKNPTSSEIEILDVKPIQHQALIQYLGARKISIQTTQLYCKEVTYRIKGRSCFSIGLQNKEGGWELRNKYFKISSSPKAYTYLKNNADRLIIIEGMFDLLSMAELYPNQLENSDVIVLNSLSFLEPVSELFEKYKEVELYLDHDASGRIHSKELTDRYSNVKDKSECYIGYKDLNVQLISIRKEKELTNKIKKLR
ncbi:Toprim domain-containing protein [Gillisia mitskevichiae]|uniref:Toprim domain-containing protein n=1 Tax=Gillisia mitskevichiae TaxID=270921 RepID=A0A495PZS0_9FLAO|nr:toprim domain-containing protein [Gillisia mitskevichiae]RKS56027.1 Toprim domain-containing protein [Gillisia mitskevichiae]